MNYKVADVYTQLRAQALALTAESIGAAAPVHGVVMETGYDGVVATLVALADGTSSLYFSNGGGIIGGGQHASVADAARALVAFAARHLDGLKPLAAGVDPPLPQPGHTRFFVLTSRGRLTAEALEEELGHKRHAHSPLFHSAQVLMTQIRLVDEARK